MSNTCVLDACALIAMLHHEPGADAVFDVLAASTRQGHGVLMHRVNLLEVYYDAYRRGGAAHAKQLMQIIRRSRIVIVSTLDDTVFEHVGRLKTLYRLSLADTIALATALLHDATLVTGDHHEMDIIEKQEPIRFHWFR